MKICSKCGILFYKNNFCKDNKSKDGLQSQCKACKVEYLIIYYKNHPRKSRKIYELKKYNKNKVSLNISRRIRQSLRGVRKAVHWEKIVGYSLIEVRNHLESNFDQYMNWGNYGTYWHIDHIIPIASFNITSVDCNDFKICWSLNNLRPLEAKENIKKSDKLSILAQW